MNIIKTLEPNHSWLVTDQKGQKIGTMFKIKDRYSLFRQGKELILGSDKELEAKWLIPIPAALESKNQLSSMQINSIDGYPIKHVAHNISRSTKINSQTYTKHPKSITRYAVGFWVVQFPNTWGITWCPRVQTLETWNHQGPFVDKKSAKEAINRHV